MRQYAVEHQCCIVLYNIRQGKLYYFPLFCWQKIILSMFRVIIKSILGELGEAPNFVVEYYVRNSDSRK